MSGFAEGSSHATRGQLDQPYINDGDPGPHGGGTYTGHGLNPTVEDYENVFGPAARDIKFDTQRAKRHQRWHLPDALKGPNPFLTDRIDGLITDATNSPFTTVILPYQYVANPDAKLKWNVWSFDEGMASRVPYESAARVLTQTKKSFAGYVVRQGLAITMEHNFMKSPAGMENFRNQLKQLVGSIQYTNDLDVHMALIQAPSYARTVAEKYFSSQKTPMQLCREYIDLFGILQKTPNALDILIEEAKGTLRNWGSQPPSFLLTNGRLTTQLQMSPERTSYVTQGYDGLKRLRTGPDIDSYRGLNIIKSRAFSTEAGLAPRDPLCRRVRVAEYYRIIPDENIDAWLLYDQSKDTWFELKLEDLVNYSKLDAGDCPHVAPVLHAGGGAGAGHAGGGRARIIHGVHASQAPQSLQSAAALDARCTTIPHSEWAGISFQQKITRMTGSASVRITDGGSSTECLALDTTAEGDDATELPRIMDIVLSGNGDTSAFQNVLNWSSAWFGGGIFCDTTSHILPGNRNQFDAPVANWTAIALDQATEAAYNNLGNDERAAFEAFRPNGFGFKWVGAHSEMNLSIDSNLTSDAVVGAAFAVPTLSDGVLALLCTDMRRFIKNNTVREYYKFLMPAEFDNNRAWDTSDRRVAAWNSLAMVWMMSRVHPLSDVRAVSRKAIMKLEEEKRWGNDALHAGIERYVANYFQATATTADAAGRSLNDCMNLLHSDRGVLFGSLNMDVRSERSEVATHNSYMESDREAILDIASIVFAKRLFCGTRRFHEGGTTDGTTPHTYGLSLLSRKFAHIESTRGGALGAGAPAMGVLGEKCRYCHEEAGDTSRIDKEWEYVIIRPNIEHEMLGVIMGRGGSGELGATLWGQTELSCYDDSQHGVWGMSYKYHERAQVFNEKNMIRLWDIAFNGYNGGMDDSVFRWSVDDRTEFHRASNDMSRPYQGPSMIVMRLPRGGAAWQRNWPSPIVFHDDIHAASSRITADPECIHDVVEEGMRVFKNNSAYHGRYEDYKRMMPDFDAHQRLRKPAGNASAQDETSSVTKLAFQGSLKARLRHGGIIDVQTGCGHLGPSYVGVASVREGKGYKQMGAPALERLV